MGLSGQAGARLDRIEARPFFRHSGIQGEYIFPKITPEAPKVNLYLKKVRACGANWQIERDPLHFWSFLRVPNLGSELSVSALMVVHEMNYQVGNDPK